MMTPENSFICEKCGAHKFDGNMCVLSCTKWYEGLICMDCANEYYPSQLEKAILERDKDFE